LGVLLFLLNNLQFLYKPQAFLYKFPLCFTKPFNNFPYSKYLHSFVKIGLENILNKKWFASWGYENSKKLAFLILACIARYVQKMPIFSA